MREYKCDDPIGPGVVVRAPERACVFCEHCTDVFWDYTNGPYWLLCDIHNDVVEVDGPWGNCPDFQEDKEMTKINLSKEYKDLLNSSGKTLEELLGVAAEYTVDCDNCAIRSKCDELKSEITCDDIWAGHLMGVNNGEA